jgi:DNA helicase II / ATP-dependent DNA helicase PcrA
MMPAVGAEAVFQLISGNRPTPEQQQAIEQASVGSHSLVVAGAGSGKTQLMAARALWLVSNELATPGQLLGLTFTRKAASELNQRVLSALYQLRESELWPASLEFDFDAPKITTYNGFANELFRQAALAAGREPDSLLLGEAASFQLAEQITLGAGSELAERLASFDQRPQALAGHAIRMAQELTDNGVKPAHAAEYLRRASAKIAALPQSVGGKTEVRAYTQQYLDAISLNQLIVGLAQEFSTEKQRRNLIDFADQVAIAAQIPVERFDLPYRFVLLDEYQDTSPMQADLLAKIFAKRSVMAVGDPNQAIYGWRGAGADSLQQFFQRFGGSPQIFKLSTSWRSGTEVLRAVNLVAERMPPAGDLPSLELAAATGAEAGAAKILFAETVASEAEQLADWFAKRIDRSKSFAVLLRSRALMLEYAQALGSRGLPVEISGIGGLTLTPEVLDVVAGLKVIAEPEAGTHLMRLLAGARWRVSPRDLAGLAKHARVLTRIRPEASSIDPVTIIEALDDLLRNSTNLDISAAGLDRMHAAAELFAQLRVRSGQRLTEFVRLVATELMVDIELIASGQNLRNLEAFYQVVEDYEANSLRPSLGGFLSWLEHAEARERLEPPKRPAAAGVIQIVTAHSAKGLEWDYVAVPNLVADEFPARSREARGWLNAGNIPGELRADAGVLPQWNWESAQDQRELKASFEAYQDELRAHRLAEERRLMYVAASRARHEVLFSGAFWKPNVKGARQPSGFLLELAEAFASELPDESEFKENPYQLQPMVEQWPSRIESPHKTVAQQVLAAKPSELGELRLLLTERELRMQPVGVQLPRRLSASALTLLLTEGEALLASIKRPMPGLAGEQAALGSEFHAALEFGYAEDLDTAFDELADRRPELESLIANFKRSEFASQKPRFLEQSIEIVIADLVVVCKLDAVFQVSGGYHIVDWKTGSEASVTEAYRLQLSLYRAALANWLGIGLEKVSASLYFVSKEQLLTPDNLLGPEQLKTRVLEQFFALGLNHRNLTGHLPE